MVRIIIYSVVIIIVITGTVIAIWPHFFPALFSSIARPFWRFEFSVDTGSLKSQTNLLIENETLRRKLDEATVKLETVSAFELDNQELRQLVGRATSSKTVLAAVIKHPPASPYDEIIIDAGSDVKLAVGDMVYAGSIVPVGKVAEVLGETSKVILFSSPGQKYDVEIGQNRWQATAIGRGGGQYEAELPRDMSVSEGDVVTAPSVFTKPIGKVLAIVADPTEAFQTIVFAPPLNIYEVRWVNVDVGHSR